MYMHHRQTHNRSASSGHPKARQAKPADAASDGDSSFADDEYTPRCKVRFAAERVQPPYSREEKGKGKEREVRQPEYQDDYRSRNRAHGEGSSREGSYVYGRRGNLGESGPYRPQSRRGGHEKRSPALSATPTPRVPPRVPTPPRPASTGYHSRSRSRSRSGSSRTSGTRTSHREVPQYEDIMYQQPGNMYQQPGNVYQQPGSLAAGLLELELSSDIPSKQQRSSDEDSTTVEVHRNSPDDPSIARRRIRDARLARKRENSSGDMLKISRKQGRDSRYI
ncbi:hypothetical protein GGR54DRAFT_23363 [Hypoxylon sp. NC1633]|nr:hypothetical protein GGR54DRAFT_23363 [Hypoxylon sp. NC1633]